MGEETKDTKSLFLANAGQDTGAQDNNKREVIEPLAKVDIPQAKAEVQNPAGLAMPKQQVQEQKTEVKQEGEEKQESNKYTVDPTVPYVWLKNVNPYKQMTPAEIEAQKKKERQEKIFSAIGDGISALSNLYFASQGAPSSYDPKTSMSAKTKERWDKLKKMQQEQQEKGFEYNMRIAELEQAQKNKDREFNFNVAEAKRNQGNIDRQFEYNKTVDDWNAQFRENEAKRDQGNIDRNFELREKQYKQGVKEFNVTSQQEATRLENIAKQLARQEKEGKYTFALGRGKGAVTIPVNAMNAANVSYIFSLLPENVRENIKGKFTGQERVYVLDENGNHIPDKNGYDKMETRNTYAEPSLEAMLIAIGANVESSEDVQNALRELANADSMNLGLDNDLALKK